jgi:D-glucosaminate-6-phosphate ammonia-lyase
MGIYESLGVKPIINATGTFTRLSGSLMPREVVQAMVEAAQAYVCLEELQYRAGQIIAGLTGAEAAYIVSGAQAGIVLSIAACITGLDPAKMNQLPNTAGMKDEVIMAKAHRNHYDHAVEAAGGKIVEVGTDTNCRPEDIEAAINDQTAAIFFLPDWPRGNIALEAVVEIGRRHNLPVVVDGAGRLSNPDCLRAYIVQGADLVIFSGGKFVRGPQASGFICGRRELISAIAWQHMDMDITPAVWTAPRELLDAAAMPFTPRQGIGRGYKAGKEEIVGLVTALRLYVARDHAAERAAWEQKLGAIVDGLAGQPYVQAEFLPAGSYNRDIPHAHIKLDEAALGISAYEFTRKLAQGERPIHPSDRELAQGAIIIHPFGLLEGDEAVIVQRIKAIIDEVSRAA